MYTITLLKVKTCIKTKSPKMSGLFLLNLFISVVSILFSHILEITRMPN